ncbi:hypothetical protein IWZ03DRAFT_237032 [Phyllosticta citriasiana]|uniref:Secreted protein n=1 Tax=Phyllosticta citriasiana TaxID=595635 RepID=A0ABR1KIH6_9PEZI
MQTGGRAGRRTTIIIIIIMCMMRTPPKVESDQLVTAQSTKQKRRRRRRARRQDTGHPAFAVADSTRNSKVCASDQCMNYCIIGRAGRTDRWLISPQTANAKRILGGVPGRSIYSSVAEMGAGMPPPQT